MNKIHYITFEIEKENNEYHVVESLENVYGIAMIKKTVGKFNTFQKAMDFSHKHRNKFKDLNRNISTLPRNCDKEYQEHLDYVKANKIKYLIDSSGNAIIKQGRKLL
jgi:hypothetical protein